MATQSLLIPEVVALKGGVDFVTPRPVVAPGTLTSCLNFEVAERSGYQRIFGVERFDGHASIANIYSNSYYSTYTTTTSDLAVGQELYMTGDDPNQAFATVTALTGFGTASGTVTYAIHDFAKFYFFYFNYTTTLQNGTGTAYDLSGSAPVAVPLSSQYTTNSDFLTALTLNYVSMRDHVSILATMGMEDGVDRRFHPAVGLQMFKDQLYGFVDCNSILFDTGGGSGFITLVPGDTLVATGHALAIGDGIVIRDIQVYSGGFSDSTASGKILYSVYNGLGAATGPYNNISTITHSLVSGNGLDLYRNGVLVQANVCVIKKTTADTPNPTWMATMFRSWSANQLPIAEHYTSQGWQEVDLGWKCSYNTGTVNGPFHPVWRDPNPVAAGIVSTDPQVPQVSNTTFGAFGTWQTIGVGTFPAQIASQNDSKYLQHGGTQSTNNLDLVTCGFSDLPRDAYITGITVQIAGSFGVFNSGNNNPFFKVALLLQGAPTASRTLTPVVPTTTPNPTTLQTVGGIQDLWGATSVKYDDLLDPSFGVSISGHCTGNHAPTYIVDQVLVTVHYQTTSSIYYFYNGTDDVQGVVTTYNIDSGDFTTGDAQGEIQVSRVMPYSTATRNNISSGDEVRTAPGGAGVQIATITSDMVYAGTASLDQILTADSKYEMITANFFSNADWEAIYGCSGYGRAFTYDGFYFRNIYTGTTATIDNPRHVVFFNFHLGLGYSSGALLTSVVGDPENFDGVLGAGEFDTGDGITGLLRLSGTALGLFCTKSIHALNGTDNTNFSMSVLSPYEGAGEYTIVDAGIPVYVSNRGISTLTQSAAYGDFERRRLSNKITSWLLPRITGSTYANNTLYQSTTISDNTGFITAIPATKISGVLFALPFRSKNQYRLYLKDGTVLTMTMSDDPGNGGVGDNPEFTIQQLFDSNQTYIPMAHSTYVDSTGRDRNHMSFYCPFQDLTTIPTDGLNYVYEMDRGWGWDGVPIYAFITITDNFFDNPFEIATLKSVRVHGVGLGVASLTLAISSNYGTEDFTATFADFTTTAASGAIPQDLSLPRSGLDLAPTDFFYSDFTPTTNIVNMAKQGRSFSMQFLHDTIASSQAEPPFILQHLMAQITVDRADV